MGVKPKKPSYTGNFVGQVDKTNGTKPGTAFGNGRSTQHWKWTGYDWVKISEKQYNALKDIEDKLKDGAPEQMDAAIDPASIRFPADIATGGDSSYVLFSFYKYKPPFQDKVGASSGLTVNKKDGTKVVLKNNEYVNQDLNAYNRGGVLTEEFEQAPNLKQIMLYMPDDIQDAYKADWEGKAFGSATAGILGAAGQEGIGKKLNKALSTAAGAGNRLGVNAAASVITSLAKGVTGDTITASDVFSGISGVIKNPNVELLFQKMNLRTFDLTFKLSPYNAKEAENIKTIVSTFKRAMLPSYSLGDSKVFGYAGEEPDGDGNQNFALEAGFIRVPQLCQVMFMHGSSRNGYLPKYKMCALSLIHI